MSAPDSVPLKKLSCPEGYELAREILCPLVEFDPHDYQLEGICKALDGHHLLAIIPTGGGKSIFYFGYILLMKHLKNDTRVHISLRDKWPEKPGLLYVSPTNGLELEQAFVWQRKYGLKCITINVDTVRLASEAKPPRNLWKAELADMILLSPERLIGKSCQDFIHVDEVWERLCALGVDEIQFLDTWGSRQVFPHCHQWSAPETRGGSTPLDRSLSAAALDSHCFPIQFRVFLEAPVSGNRRNRPTDLEATLSYGRALHITWLSSLFKLRNGELQILPFLMGMHPMSHLWQIWHRGHLQVQFSAGRRRRTLLNHRRRS